MPVRSAWLLNRTDPDGGQSRVDTRLAPTGTMTPTGPLATRDGIIPGSADGKTVIAGLALIADGPMAAKVAPGRAVVQGTEPAGAYPVVLPAHETVTFTDGNPANPRIDLVALRVYDQLFDSSGRTLATLEVIAGEPQATPVAPATPTGAIALHHVRVQAGASAGTGGISWATAVSDRRRATVAAGGILPYTGSLAFNGAYPGQYRDNGKGLERWDGTTWTAYPPVPTWQSWTPAWSTSTNVGVPTYGNAVIACRYLHTGRIVNFRFSVTFGTTTKFGTGDTGNNWTFSLPVTYGGSGPTLGFFELAASTSNRVVARVRGTGSTRFSLDISSGKVNGEPADAGSVDRLSPWTWGVGDTILGLGTYEAAQAAP
ncbi:hypothetical protein ACIHCQ_01000 [Streptomyces sp. NPDC052236]|uniref:hypothetical protein n=1 Tax=Streptomyces sp. NPDC052236 TaxID=3365686 RepID=UPI0037D935FC